MTIVKKKPPIPDDLIMRLTTAMSAWGVEQMGATAFDAQPPWQKKATFAMVRSGLEALNGYDFMLLLDRLETSDES